MVSGFKISRMSGASLIFIGTVFLLNGKAVQWSCFQCCEGYESKLFLPDLCKSLLFCSELNPYSFAGSESVLFVRSLIWIQIFFIRKYNCDNL